MRIPVTLLLVAVLSLGACGKIRESRLNPFNWFGRSEPAVAVVPAEGAGDGRTLVAQVTDLEVARQSAGAVITATGLPPTQGWWNTDLVAENDGEPVDGVLTYRFVLSAPLENTRSSTPQSRELTAATFISSGKLESIRQIVVTGAGNSMSSRR